MIAEKWIENEIVLFKINMLFCFDKLSNKQYLQWLLWFYFVYKDI